MPAQNVSDCLRLINSTSVDLTSFSRDWATFSAGVCGAQAHIVYDPDAAQPLYLQVTKANVNDITAAKAIPVRFRRGLCFRPWLLRLWLVGGPASGRLPHRDAAQGQYAF